MLHWEANTSLDPFPDQTALETIGRGSLQKVVDGCDRVNDLEREFMWKEDTSLLLSEVLSTFAGGEPQALVLGGVPTSPAPSSSLSDSSDEGIVETQTWSQFVAEEHTETAAPGVGVLAATGGDNATGTTVVSAAVTAMDVDHGNTPGFVISGTTSSWATNDSAGNGVVNGVEGQSVPAASSVFSEPGTSTADGMLKAVLVSVVDGAAVAGSGRTTGTSTTASVTAMEGAEGTTSRGSVVEVQKETAAPSPFGTLFESFSKPAAVTAGCNVGSEVPLGRFVGTLS